MPVVSIGGNDVSYADVGEGPTLVFVHGLFMNGGIWSAVTDQLRDRFRCITPDLPLGGHQQPVRPGTDVRPIAVASSIPKFLAALDLRDVTLVANDTGTALVLIALDSDEPGLRRIGRLVLTNGDSYENFPPAPMRGMAFVAKFGSGPAGWLLARTARTDKGRRKMLATLTNTATNTSDIPPAAAASLGRLGNIGIRRDAIRFISGMHRSVTLDAADAITQFTEPVLLAWGRADEVFPVSHAKRLAEAFPKAALIEIPGSRTYVMVDAPDRLAQLIDEFTTQTGREATS